jgi:hypothetical protein
MTDVTNLISVPSLAALRAAASRLPAGAAAAAAAAFDLDPPLRAALAVAFVSATVDARFVRCD